MEKVVKIPEVKICGITSRQEINYLNEAKADYAGFVFYEKSKRNVSFAQAKAMMGSLLDGIKKVAVTVSPTVELLKTVEMLGFDLLQVHGELPQEIKRNARIPIWRAINITGEKELELFLKKQTEDTEQIEGYVVDGAGYGGGKPFDWKQFGQKICEFTAGKKLILAGGLTEENVRQGIFSFSPDVVDVSSGVEENGRKSEEKIKAFIRKVRENEQ